MVFFRLGRPVQVALVGAALAAGPSTGSGCDDGSSDGHDTTDTHDADADGDAAADGDGDLDHGADGDADGDGDAAADGDADVVDDDGTVEVDTWEVVDPAPGPMCADLPAYTLSTSPVSGDANKATAEVRLAGEVRPFGDPCSRSVCLEVTPVGAGTVDGYFAVDANTARFTYTNPALTSWDAVQLNLVWHLYCTTETMGEDEQSATGTAWTCRDFMTGNVTIVERAEDCISVVDPPPPPMAKTTPPGARGGGFRLLAGPVRDNAVRLRADGAAAAYKWTSIGGSLERLGEAEAVFRFDPAAPMHLVQVAAILPGGVSIQVYRRQRG